jgi:hypothetical protein
VSWAFGLVRAAVSITSNRPTVTAPRIRLDPARAKSGALTMLDMTSRASKRAGGAIRNIANQRKLPPGRRLRSTDPYC